MFAIKIWGDTSVIEPVSISNQVVEFVEDAAGTMIVACKYWGCGEVKDERRNGRRNASAEGGGDGRPWIVRVEVKRREV